MEQFLKNNEKIKIKIIKKKNEKREINNNIKEKREKRNK